MDIQRLNGHSFAEFKANTIWGRRTLGSYLLIIPVEIDVYPVFEGSNSSLHNLTCHLSLRSRNTPSLIGEMYSLNGPKIYSTSKNPYKPQHEFAIKLTHREIDQIEIARNGSDLAFDLKFYGHVYEGDQIRDGQLERTLHVDQSAWLKVLENLGYSKTLTIEIPTSGDRSNPKFEEVYKKLHESQVAFSRGEWRQSVALCRDLLELIRTYDDDFSHKTAHSQTERYQLIQKFLHLTHLAKHYDTQETRTASWTREDSLFMLASCGALIQKLSVTEN